MELPEFSPDGLSEADWLALCLENEAALRHPACPLHGRELEMVFIGWHLKKQYGVKASISALSKLQGVEWNWIQINCTCRDLADPAKLRKIPLKNREIRQVIRAGYEQMAENQGYKTEKSSR